MCIDDVTDRSTLQYEPSLAAADVRVSRALTTPNGDKIRAIVTTGGTVVLMAVGRPDGDTITVVGLGTTSIALTIADIWDKVKKGVIAGVKGALGGGEGGGGCTPTANVTQTFDGNGRLVGQTITVTCTPG